MNKINQSVLTACGLVGSQVKLARILGISPAYVQQMVKGTREVPANHAVTIERATFGEVKRQDLRPHDFWCWWPDLDDLAPQQILDQITFKQAA